MLPSGSTDGTGTSCQNNRRYREARILKEALEGSYRKGGVNASIKGVRISKAAVMNKLYKLEFPALKADEKKELKMIYIDADGDYVSLQYLEHKGDIRKLCVNTGMPRSVYVYEGVDKMSRLRLYSIVRMLGYA